MEGAGAKRIHCSHSSYIYLNPMNELQGQKLAAKYIKSYHSSINLNSSELNIKIYHTFKNQRNISRLFPIS